MYKEGYVVTLYGNRHLKNTLFLDHEPTANELQSLVKENSAVRAVVAEGKEFVIAESYMDKNKNIVEVS